MVTELRLRSPLHPCVWTEADRLIEWRDVLLALARCDARYLHGMVSTIGGVGVTLQQVRIMKERLHDLLWQQDTVDLDASVLPPPHLLTLRRLLEIWVESDTWNPLHEGGLPVWVGEMRRVFEAARHSLEGIE